VIEPAAAFVIPGNPFRIKTDGKFGKKRMSTISEVLTRKGSKVLTSTSDASVLDAIKVMSEANIGALIIQDGDQPVGIFTERDYLRKIALEGRSSSDTRLHEVMSSPLITVDAAEPIRVAMETMTERRCRHLVVMENEAMAGIVSLGDLVKHLLLVKEAEVEQLSQYIAGTY
jgi:CBS domain-containing protein